MVISDFLNRHEGARGFVVASGPSLADLDTELLRDETTIVVNDAFFVVPDPTYICVMDREPFFKLKDKPQVLFHTRRKFRNIGVYVPNLGNSDEYPISFNLVDGVYGGFTTTFVALQLALWMGFSEIGLIGLDLTRTKDKTHVYGEKEDFERLTARYFERMKKAFETNADIISKKARVWNCSDISTLTCFPYKSVKEIIDETRLAY